MDTVPPKNTMEVRAAIARAIDEAHASGAPIDRVLQRLANQLGRAATSRSFSLVDGKVAEAEFFLRKIEGCGFNFFEVQCYASAFVSSARSITFALQAVMSEKPSFAQWYGAHQAALKIDPLARFFHNFRTSSQHIGHNLVGGGSGASGKVHYYFSPTPEVPDVPVADLLTAATTYFRTILQVVYDCYLRFGPDIDEQQRYTAEYFHSIGKTIEDAEEELGFPRGWLRVAPFPEAYQWQALRDHAASGCEINHIFERYLGRVTPMAARLPAYSPDGK